MDEKHLELVNILKSYGCQEYGTEIVDKICDLFEYPETIEHSDCTYREDGKDTDGTQWYICTTHDQPSLTDMYPCETAYYLNKETGETQA